MIIKEKIRTTEPKAKEIRPRIEKLISKGKSGNLDQRRQIASRIDVESANKIVNVLSPRYKERNGGYTRITKLPPRRSDNTKMALIEFVK